MAVSQQRKNRLFEFWLLFFLILASAVYLRSLHLDFGLPQRLHPDEWSQVEVAQRISHGDLNPHFFRYPSGHMYFLAFIFKLFSLEKLPDLYFSARIVSVVYGAATVLLTMGLTTLLWGRWTALFSGVLMSLNYTAIQQSHYAVVDVPTTFWMLAAFLAIAAAAVKKEKKGLWAAAVLIGIASSHKYTAFLVLPALWISTWSFSLQESEKDDGAFFPVVFLSSLGIFCLLTGAVSFFKKEFILNLLTSLTEDGYLEPEYLHLYNKLSFIFLLAGVISFGLLIFKRKKIARLLNPRWFFLSVLSVTVFALMTPYSFLDWRASMHDFFYEYRHMQLGSLAHYTQAAAATLKINTMDFHGLGGYLAWLLKDMGWGVFVFAPLSAVPLWKKSKIFFCAIALYVFLYMTAIGSWRNWAARYMLPLYPVFSMLAAAGWSRVAQEARSKKAVNVAFILVTSLWLIFPIIHTERQIKKFLLPDTREAAWSWFSKNVPGGAVVCTDPFSPDLQMLPQRVVVRPILEQKVLQEEDCQFYVAVDGNRRRFPPQKKQIAYFAPFQRKYEGKVITVYK